MGRQMGVVGERMVGVVVRRVGEAVVRREMRGRRHCGRLVRQGNDRLLVVGAGQAEVVVWRAKAGEGRRTVEAAAVERVLRRAEEVARASRASAMMVEERAASCRRVVVAWASHQESPWKMRAGGCS